MDLFTMNVPPLPDILSQNDETKATICRSLSSVLAEALKAGGNCAVSISLNERGEIAFPEIVAAA